MQPQNSLSRIPRWLLILIALFVAGLIGWAIYYNHTVFRVTGTNPNVNSVSYLAPFFKINFSQSLKPEDVKVTISPNILLSTSVNNKTLTINLDTMSKGSTYSITVDTIHSNNGKTISNLQYQFMTSDISFNRLPKDQQDEILARQDQKPAANNDWVFNITPHSTLDYNLTAAIRNDGDGDGGAGSGDYIYLRAELLLTAADVRSNRDAAVARYKQEVVDYITGVGLNINNYVIDYVIIEPTI